MEEGKGRDGMFCLQCLGVLFFLTKLLSWCLYFLLWDFEIKLYHSPQPSGWPLWINSIWNLMTTTRYWVFSYCLLSQYPFLKHEAKRKDVLLISFDTEEWLRPEGPRKTLASLNLLPGRACHRDVAVGSLCSGCLTCMQAITGDQAGRLSVSCPCRQSRGPHVDWASEHSEKGFLGFWAKTMEIFKTEQEDSKPSF